MNLFIHFCCFNKEHREFKLWPSVAALSIAGWLASGHAQDDLTISRLSCASNAVNLYLTTSQPGSPHDVLESRDLHGWQLVPKPQFHVLGGQNLHVGFARGSESNVFYRGLCLGTSAPPVYVNIQVDAELDDTTGLLNVTTELRNRGINTTVYATADYANRNATLITALFREGTEIALHGYYTGEQLATMTYAEQKDLLSRAKKAVEGCQPCGTYRPVVGFRPQYFSQNEDTYRVLDELGLTHNSGFKAGELYLPGHAAAVWPYWADGHQFYAIPISTVPWGTNHIYLCDIACAQSLQFTGAQWRQALMTGLTTAVLTRRPLVILLHGWYTGDQTQYTYWQPFVDFLDAAQGRVTFVNSSELVTLAQNRLQGLLPASAPSAMRGGANETGRRD